MFEKLAMAFNIAKDASISNKRYRGQLSALPLAVAAFVAVIAAALALMLFIFVGGTLNSSLSSTAVWAVWGNIVTSTTNFTTQLGTVGTIAGVSLILVVVGSIAFFGYNRLTGGNGGSGM